MLDLREKPAPYRHLRTHGGSKVSAGRIAGAALGRLFRNLRNPQFLAAQAAETAMSIYVLNPLGQKVIAYFKRHVFDGEAKIGEVYGDNHGNEYLHANGKTYRYDSASDTWTTA